MNRKLAIKLSEGLCNKPTSIIFTLIYLFITTSLISCTTMQAYKGAPLPRSEVAQVKGVDEYFLFYFKVVSIASIDGEKTTGRGHSVEMLPGWHTLSVAYSSGFLTTTYNGKGVCYIKLNAMPGANYKINGESTEYGNHWHAWLENTETGDKVNCDFNQPKGDPI